MEDKDLQELGESLFEIFQGLEHGMISFSLDKLNCAMGTCVCEVFSNVVESVWMKINDGKEVTKEDLQELYTNLKSFEDEYRVNEIKPLRRKINKIIKTL